MAPRPARFARSARPAHPACFVRVAGVAVAAGAMLGGCGLLDTESPKKLDTRTVEKEINDRLEARAPGSRVDDAQCPDDVEIRPGATFTCTVTYDGERADVVVTMRDDAGRVAIELPG